MRRSGDIWERLTRIDETMAAREEVDESRAEVHGIWRSPRTRLASTVIRAAGAIAFAGPMAAIAGRVGIAPRSAFFKDDARLGAGMARRGPGGFQREG